ncbi:hypothetical protein [Pantoea ananatis]|uniref:hypothetical protein n=1 Tax=Pantoea ananas TaxID=553 RepID=UPI0021E74B60|nr:hypothetical protein [Pantoea ananatis]MCW0309555.1 hypothetical protein [Pantoea ananatis]MCW0341364.1 hypothetical protein [Pantoea ananatis]MCW0359846.1 hypothetical protein [Pantoea ananatis]MCW0364422.1 hypothetical protein [Pantoea ananatis]MCW1776850.1 hypothetical protein [Pantoea ananatis]
MKSFTRNNLIAALVLGALGAPLSAYAATQTTVTITATVTAKFSVAATNPDEMTENQTKTAMITTSHNAPAKITIVPDNINGATDYTFNMKGQAVNNSGSVLPVQVKVHQNDNAKFTGTRKEMVVNLPGNGPQTITTLNLTTQTPAASLHAGKYQGVLTVTVSAA